MSTAHSWIDRALTKVDVYRSIARILYYGPALQQKFRKHEILWVGTYTWYYDAMGNRRQQAGVLAKHKNGNFAFYNCSLVFPLQSNINRISCTRNPVDLVQRLRQTYPADLGYCTVRNDRVMGQVARCVAEIVLAPDDLAEFLLDGVEA